MPKTIRLAILSLGLVLLSACTQKGDSASGPIDISRFKPLHPFEGRIVFNSNLDGDNDIYLLTGDGLTRLTDNSWNDEYPVWSPDGSLIAFSANPGGNHDIFIMNADGSNLRAVVSTPADDTTPAWFPDGKSLAFASGRKRLLRKEFALFRVDLESGRTESLIPGFNKTNFIPWVSPATGSIVFTGKRTVGWDVAVFEPKTGRTEFLHDGGGSCRARYSADGRWLAYVSTKNNPKSDIWIMKPDGSDKTPLTSSPDVYDYYPAWSPDGRFVVFDSSPQHDQNGDWALHIVDTRNGEDRLLFDSPGNDVFPDWK